MSRLWEKSRSGSHAGRGFHYQDAVATEFAIRAWHGQLPLARLIPEGLEDVSLELDHALHLQAKSRRSHRGDFSDSELAGAWRHLAERGGADTGLQQTFADVADRRLKTAVATAVSEIVAPDDFLARAHVLVMPATPSTAVAMLAERLGIPPASCCRPGLELTADRSARRPFRQGRTARTPDAAA